MSSFWPEYHKLWLESPPQTDEEWNQHWQAARERIADSSDEDWLWLEDALHIENSKFFVAQLLEDYPLPERLFSPMILAGVLENDPSYNQDFINPCGKTFGSRKVIKELLDYLENGSNKERAGSARALYWAFRHPKGDNLDDMRQRNNCALLREFVDNPNLQVRQCIIPMLELDPDDYPEELHELIPKAIHIAKTHRNSYIRERVEVQLGHNSIYRPLPTEAQTGSYFGNLSRGLARLFRRIFKS